MPPHQRRRRRTALSCTECRRRKLKCDRKHPCSNCITAKATCSFDHSHGRHEVSNSSRNPEYDPSPRTQSHAFLPSAPTGEPDHVDEEEQSGTQLQPESPSDADRQPRTSQDILQRASRLAHRGIHMNKTKTLRSSHWMAFADQVRHSQWLLDLHNGLTPRQARLGERILSEVPTRSWVWHWERL